MKKTIYVAPEVELMECRVEKGFAGSAGLEDMVDAHLYDDEPDGEKQFN